MKISSVSFETNFLKGRIRKKTCFKDISVTQSRCIASIYILRQTNRKLDELSEKNTLKEKCTLIVWYISILMSKIQIWRWARDNFSLKFFLKVAQNMPKNMQKNVGWSICSIWVQKCFILYWLFEMSQGDEMDENKWSQWILRPILLGKIYFFDYYFHMLFCCKIRI